MNPSDSPYSGDGLDAGRLVRETSFGAYLLYAGAFLALMVFGGVAVWAFGQQAGVFVYQFVAILGVAVLYRAIVGKDVRPWPSIRGFGLRWYTVVAALVTIVLLGFLGNVTMGLMVEYVPGLEENAAAYSERIRELLLDAEGVNWWLGMMSVCISAPLAEEALFRGTILQEQRKSELGLWALAGLNGGLFALFHVFPLVIPSLILLGTFLAYITLISESLLMPIVAHAAINTVNGVVLPQLMGSGVGPLKGESAGPAELWIWFVGLAVASSLGWWIVAWLGAWGTAGRQSQSRRQRP